MGLLAAWAVGLVEDRVSERELHEIPNVEILPLGVCSQVVSECLMMGWS